MPPIARRLLLLSPAIAFVFLGAFAQADSLDAPAGYYATATGTGTSLKSQLYTITSTGFHARSYGDARYSAAVTDVDPANPAKILLVYNRASVPKAWDAGVTWNREHVWPQSLLGQSVDNSSINLATDQFELRPANPSINSTRSNTPYGSIRSASTVPYGNVTDSSGQYFYPGDADRGDVSRTLFYMATRYGQSQAHNLTLVNGQPTTYQMGDLASLLRYNYLDPVDTFERNRNQVIYSSTLNPTYYQGNRNPFIDHPEYVWAIFGTEANNSKLAIGTAASDGSSTTTVDLGRVIAGSNFGTNTLTLSKTGTTPTTFDATVSGSATSTISTARNTFDYNTGTKAFTVGLAGSTSTVGARTGTITFDNTDLTSAGTGMGLGDGNDVVNVSGSVVSHAQPSLSTTLATTAASVDLGIFALNSSPMAQDNLLQIANRGAAGDFVAGLDVDAVQFNSGDESAFVTGLGSSVNLPVGSSLPISPAALTNVLGSHAAQWRIKTSDENIPGATALSDLTVTLSARIAYGGDANLDDAVNFDDLVIVAQDYDMMVGNGWYGGDFDHSGSVDFNDLVMLAQNYGVGSSLLGDPGSLGSSFAADWVLAQSLAPEPIVLMPALLSLTLLRRRRA